MGGSKIEAPTPPAPAPSPTETSKQAIQAQIDALPQQLESQKEFGPQFTQQQLDQIQEFGPQFAQAGIDLQREFGPQIAQATRDEQAILDPSRVAGSEAVTEFLEGGPGELTEREKTQIDQDVLAAQSATGFGESGFTADEIINRRFGARQQLKNRFLNVGLSASGRLPSAGQQNIQAPSAAAGPGQLVQNVNPSTFFGGQAAQNQSQGSIFGSQANIFSTQVGAQTARRGQNLALAGQIFTG